MSNLVRNAEPETFFFFGRVTYWVCQDPGQTQHWYAVCKDGLSEYVSDNRIEKKITTLY